MGRVAREAYSVEELVAMVAEAKAELEEAERAGRYGRAYTEAANILRQRMDRRPAKEIAREVVDRLMEY
ncbi:MAG: hypothetical protein ACRDM0_05505 [Thermoleophilaceae bacterium]